MTTQDAGETHAGETYAGETSAGEANPVHLPDPTPWPMVLALGVTLSAAGLVTEIVVSGVGVVLLVVALLMMVREDIAKAERDLRTGS